MVGHGRYTVLRKLADGGMAEIFLAKQHGSQGFEKLVVLKRIHTAFVADEQFRNMLIDEAHISMTLSHANIVQVLDLGQAGGRYFMVLELVDGWDLGRLLQRAAAANLPLPAPIALHVVAQVCRALDYAHGKTGTDGRPLGIVHRDVSPQNVLVSEQGEVKLADFGIAKALRKRESTGAGVVKGKIAFMSPEQAQGGNLDARSDLFSVGTMLYLMLSGRRPFDAPTDLESLLRVQRCDFAPLASVAPTLPEPLLRLVGRAMRLEPANRFQTADEMLQAIETVQRESFGPAGKTELKRWLAELEGRDGIVSIARAAGVGADPNETLELGDEDIELEDSGVLPVAAASPGAAPPTPESLTDGSVERVVAPRPTGPTRVDSQARGPMTDLPSGIAPTLADAGRAAHESPLFPEPGQAAPPARGGVLATAPTEGDIATLSEGARTPSAPTPAPGRRVALSTLAVLLVGGGAALALLRREHKGPPAVGSTAHPARPNSAGASQPPSPEAPSLAPGPDPVTPPEPVPEAPDERAAAEAAAADEDLDEEALLARAEQDLEHTVIGEEPATPPAAETVPAPARRPPAGRKPTPPAPVVVSVRIISEPPGAVIRLDRRVFGRAPMNLRFRSGVTYELNFVKQGYQQARKRFTVTRKKQQVVRVALKKAPAPRTSDRKDKSFFQRLFGG